jgi:hypothetical protein
MKKSPRIAPGVTMRRSPGSILRPPYWPELYPEIPRCSTVSRFCFLFSNFQMKFDARCFARSLAAHKTPVLPRAGNFPPAPASVSLRLRGYAALAGALSQARWRRTGGLILGLPPAGILSADKNPPLPCLALAVTHNAAVVALAGSRISGPSPVMRNARVRLFGS